MVINNLKVDHECKGKFLNYSFSHSGRDFQVGNGQGDFWDIFFPNPDYNRVIQGVDF